MDGDIYTHIRGSMTSEIMRIGMTGMCMLWDDDERVNERGEKERGSGEETVVKALAGYCGGSG